MAGTDPRGPNALLLGLLQKRPPGAGLREPEGVGRPARPRLGSTPGAPNLSLDSPASLVPLASCFPREVGPGVAEGLEQLNGLREHLAVFAQVCLEQVVK